MRRVAILAMCLFLVTPAYGWLRRKFEDGVVVARTELIIIGRLKPDSIRKVEHGRNGGWSGSWEFHASLSVTELLKGKLEEKEIPIVIHYGLTPVTHDRAGNNNAGKPIEIYDTGNSSRSFEPLIPDALQDQIWFLRKGLRRKDADVASLPDYWGISDPEDIQNIKHKEYFLAYLSKEPEKTVREYVAKHPDYQQRAKSYFKHFEIQRILAKPNVQERVLELLPYFAARESLWNGVDWVKEEYKRHPQEAAPELVKFFHFLRFEVPEARGAKGYGQPKWDEYCQQCREQSLRKEIICLLRDMHSPKAVSLCIDVLENAHRYWDRIEKYPETAMTELRYGKENEPKVPLPQDSIYYEVEYAVYAAWSSGNNYVQAVPLLIKTHKRWESKDYGDRRITKATLDALMRLILCYL